MRRTPVLSFLGSMVRPRSLNTTTPVSSKGSRPGTNADKPDYLVWVKHKDAHGLDSMTGLLALADMLPPAMLSTASSFVPISSMTWHMNVLVDQPPQQSAWCLLESAAESAIEGIRVKT